MDLQEIQSFLEHEPEVFKFRDISLDLQSPKLLNPPQQQALDQWLSSHPAINREQIYLFHFTPENALNQDQLAQQDRGRQLSSVEKTYNKIRFFESLLDLFEKRHKLDLNLAVFRAPTVRFNQFVKNLAQNYQLDINLGQSSPIETNGKEYFVFELDDLIDSIGKSQNQIQNAINLLDEEFSQLTAL